MSVEVQKRKIHKDPVLQKIVEVIVRTIDPDRIILFGSRARGDATTHSDYDLLILKRGIKPEDRRPLQRKIREAIRQAEIRVPIDVIVQSPDRYRYLSADPFLIYHDIENNNIVVYEK